MGAITAERGWKEFSDISPEMGEKLEKSLAERIKNGRKPIILVAGVGRGRLPIDLLMKYGIDALDIYSLNLEDESMLFNPEKLQREIRIPKEEGRSAEDYINRLKKNPNDENPNKKSRYISHDLRNGLPDFPVKFDLIIIPNHVLRYIPDCLLKVVDPLVRNALAPKGELFAAINNVVVPAANTTDQGIRSILKKLRGWKVSPDYPDILREPEFENIKPDIFTSLIISCFMQIKLKIPRI